MMDFYSQTYPIARKEHKCEFCHCTIPKGKRYSYETGKYDGEMFTRKLCPECNGILADYCNEHGYEEFDWWGITDWLSDTYCYDCPNKDSCNITPEKCEVIKGEFPHEIPEKLYKIVD